MKFNLDEYFCPVPGSEQEKEIVIFARRHWVSFLGQIILSCVILILPIVIWILLMVFGSGIIQGIILNFVVIILSVYYLVAITFTYTAWITYYYDIYIVTKDTIVDITQEGFFGRKIAQLSLLRVQDVSSNIKGILPTLFAYGDVLVETAGEQKETFLLEAVPNPQKFSAKILEIHNQLVEEGGRQSEIVEAEGVLPPGKATQEEKPQTTYQQLLEKEVQALPSAPPPPNPSSEISQPTEQPKEESSQEEGNISKDDLNKGGEVKF